MKKVYKVEDLECAHCAAKIENGIKKIDGVQSATLNFLAQKLTMEVQEGRLDAVLAEVKRIMHQVEPDCSLRA